VILTDYVRLYDVQTQRMVAAAHEIARQPNPVTPTFAINNVPENEIVIVGARLKVLALVWISGMLGLTDCNEEVERVARLAVKQRAFLYDNSTLDAFFRAQVLTMSSLYNRQILATGLLGVATNRTLQAFALQATGVQWQKRKLASYKAALTEYDLPVRSGVMKADYSDGSLIVKFTSPMDDNHFEILLKELHLIP